ncbi:hypothetical protein MMC22_010447 [Lobaria immixta]|nr:hypothetical protein [Lobaria immixta]
MLLFVILTIISAVIAIPLPQESGGTGGSDSNNDDAISGINSEWWPYASHTPSIAHGGEEGSRPSGDSAVGPYEKITHNSPYDDILPKFKDPRLGNSPNSPEPDSGDDAAQTFSKVADEFWNTNARVLDAGTKASPIGVLGAVGANAAVELGLSGLLQFPKVPDWGLGGAGGG